MFVGSRIRRSGDSAHPQGGGPTWRERRTSKGPARLMPVAESVKLGQNNRDLGFLNPPYKDSTCLKVPYNNGAFKKGLFF